MTTEIERKALAYDMTVDLYGQIVGLANENQRLIAENQSLRTQGEGDADAS